jgi:hypothetical protein
MNDEISGEVVNGNGNARGWSHRSLARRFFVLQLSEHAKLLPTGPLKVVRPWSTTFSNVLSC